MAKQTVEQWHQSGNFEEWPTGIDWDNRKGYSVAGQRIKDGDFMVVEDDTAIRVATIEEVGAFFEQKAVSEWMGEAERRAGAFRRTQAA